MFPQHELIEAELLAGYARSDGHVGWLLLLVWLVVAVVVVDDVVFVVVVVRSFRIGTASM